MVATAVSEVTSSSPDKPGTSATLSSSPSQAAGYQTSSSGVPPPGISAFACVGSHGTEVSNLGHSCARHLFQDSCSEPCFVGRVGDAPKGLSFVADKPMVVDDDGRVLVAHVSVRPSWKMPRDMFLGLLDSFFETECLKMNVGGSKVRLPRGCDDALAKPLAVCPCPSTGGPDNASPSLLLVPPSAFDRDVFHQTIGVRQAIAGPFLNAAVWLKRRRVLGI
jgi:hypothetical protein